MFAKVTTLVLFFAFLQHASSFDSRNVVFVIASQTEPSHTSLVMQFKHYTDIQLLEVEPYHAEVATRLKQNIENQVMEIEGRRPTIHITHEDFPIPGAWTIVPLLRPLLARHIGSDVRWVVFIEPHTVVRYSKLIEVLDEAGNQTDTMWIGYPLIDNTPTITHHFTAYEELEEEGGLPYPNFASGFTMRMELIHMLLNRMESCKSTRDADVSIDPSFELAQLVYGGIETSGPLLTPDLSFCNIPGDNCATYPRQFDICGSPVLEESIYFAVKTWRGYHDTRAQVVKKTWGKHVTNLMFYSDKTDPSLPAVEIGVPNTEVGHCAKTVLILKQAARAVQNMAHVRWIFLADDDTILGVQRLCEVLSCYRGGDNLTVLGERYGFGYTAKGTPGYDYISGGGGMVLSLGAARALSHCTCSEPHAPDDMQLGLCARQLGLALTHSPLFHQYLPQDYPREVLSRDRPVSFHGLGSPHPLRVYATWFHHEDMALRQRRPKDEL